MRIDEASHELIELLATTALFNDVDLASLRNIIPYFELVRLSAGELLIREGEYGDSLAIVRHGRLRVVSADAQGNEVFLSYVGIGNSVGEISVVTGGRRIATVYADQDCELLCLSRDSLERFAIQHSGDAQTIMRNIDQRLHQNHMYNALKVSRLLGELDDQLLSDLASTLERKIMRSGEVLVQEGDASDAMYIVISGRLRMIRKQADDTIIQLGELGCGETVGEIGIITGEPRTATVYAIRDSVLARLSSQGFTQLLKQHPQAITHHISAKVIRRLEGQVRGSVRAERTMATFAAVAIDRHVPLAAFTQQLALAMGRINPTRHLSSLIVDAEMGKPGLAQVDDSDPSSGRLTRWLADLETQYEYTLYEADLEPSAWADRCLRQADHILLVGDGGRPPDEVTLMEVLARIPAMQKQARLSLILLHAPDEQAPSGTLRWLNLTQVGAHYHARIGSAAHLARLARLITGNGIGVVLSGGGARGYAHLGALRALQEAGIPIDVIGGTSAGGVMAFQHAMDWDIPTMMQKNLRTVQYKFDYTFPITAIMAGGGLTDGMLNLFGDRQIEDLWLPCFCVTTSLFEGQIQVHTRGAAWKYARASSSIPGIVPPVIDDQQVLVDGGLLNNLPTEVMRQRRDIRTVFALEVTVPKPPKDRRAYPYESRLSGWSILWNRINPFAQKQHVPTIGQIMMYITVLGNQQTVKQARTTADFYMQLAVGTYGLLEFKAFEAIIASGYQSAQQTLAEWQSIEAFTRLKQTL